MTHLVEQIKRGIQGCVCYGEETQFYRRDFGQRAYGLPQIVVKATCEQDIVHCLHIANRERIPITIRGSGHSSNGQSLNENGILVINLAEQTQLTMRDYDLVEVSARTTWNQLERSLNRLGRSAPVHTDFLDLSIGGTLSVGGIGVRSIRYGLQIDQIERLRLILPDGTAKWCSFESDDELFRFSLAGLGQIGIIEKVVMKTVPYRQPSRFHVYGHRNLAALAESITWIEEDDRPLPDFFQATRMKGQVTSVFGLEGDIEKHTYRWQPEHSQDFLLGAQTVKDFPFWAHAVQQQWIGEQANHYRLWTDCFLNFNGFCDFLPFLDQLVQDRNLSPYIWAIYILVIRNREYDSRFPLSPSSIGARPFVYSVGTYCAIPKTDEKGKNRVEELCLKIQEKCLALNGRLYLHGFYKFDDEFLATLYGDDYGSLVALKQKVDPHFLLNAKVFPILDK